MATGVEEIEDWFRREHGFAVAALVRFFGDIDVAEEAVQDAVMLAVERWPVSGLPPNPSAWLVTTARHRGLDRLRQEASRRDRRVRAAMFDGADAATVVGQITDDRLRLIFTCCHPALGLSDQVALILRLLAGLSTEEIADALGVPDATVAQRLARGKRKIKATKIPYRLPSPADLQERLSPVLAVIYLIFNDGCAAPDEGMTARPDLCEEAIGLARVLAELLPDEPEVLGLLALLMLNHSRRDARIGPDSALVLLPDQDRSLWDWELIEAGQELVRVCIERDEPGPYQIQAAISAVHSAAERAEDTDWPQILALYDLLMDITPTRVVALNRAVALAEVEGPQVALDVIDKLDLRAYHLFHATRAELLERLGRHAEAAQAYHAALAIATNAAERLTLRKHLAVTLGFSEGAAQWSWLAECA